MMLSSNSKALIRYILNIDSSKIYQGYKGMMELHHYCKRVLIAQVM